MISPRRRLSLTFFICSVLSACESPKPLEMSGRMPADAVARARDGDNLVLAELQNATHGAGAAEYAIGLGLAEGWAGQKNLEQAFAWWRRAAEHGNPDAKNALAVAYAEGLNGPRDLTLARNLWQQAAEQGNANAQYNLASLLVANAETAGEMAIAADWLRRAADGGDPDAQYFLGNLYYNGEGVARQPLESLRLWRQAAEQGHVESEFSLAEAYLLGTAVPVDLAEAEKWMRKAARHGHPEAAEPASMLARGIVPQGHIVERRTSVLPNQVREIDESDEPTMPKFKAPARERVKPTLAEAKVRNTTEKRVAVASRKTLAKVADRGRSASSRGAKKRVETVAARSPARPPQVASARMKSTGAKSLPSVKVAAVPAKAAVRPSLASTQAKSGAPKKASTARQIAQANQKPKLR